MRTSAINRMIERQHQLLAALDSRDVAALETAVAALAEAVAAAKVPDAWIDDGELREKLGTALRQNDAARTRVNILTDWTRQRTARLAELRGQSAPLTYGKRAK